MAETSKTTAFATFDVIKLAREILSEVDAVRAYEEDVDENTGKGYARPSESRLNALFRLIGLPMFVNLSLKQGSAKPPKNLGGDRYMTPGFDKHFQQKLSDYTITDALELDFILISREAKLLSRESFIGTSELNRSMTLALTDPIPIAPNVMGPDHHDAFVGKDQNSRRSTYKALFPMITRYTNVTPKINQTARPFLLDARRAIISRQDTLNKPFIETVARIRLSLGAGTKSDDDRKSEFNTQIAERVGQEYANLLLKTVGQTNILEEMIISRMTASIEQLAKRWIKIRTEQERIARDLPFIISIKSSSSRDNPLGKRAAVSANVEIKKDHKWGKRLDIIQKNIAKFDSIISLMPTEDSSNPSATGTPQPKNIPKSALLNPFTSLLNNELESYKKHEATIKKIIVEEQQKADKLRLESEMMTGEFTGISVPDVLATIMGLFLISQNDLIALLDVDVRREMKASRDTSLVSAIEKAGTIDNDTTAAAIKNLETQVQNVFDLIQRQFKIEINKEQRQRNSVTRQNSRQKKDEPRSVNRQESAAARAGDAEEN